MLSRSTSAWISALLPAGLRVACPFSIVAGAQTGRARGRKGGSKRGVVRAGTGRPMKSIVGLGCQLGRCESDSIEEKTLQNLSGELSVLVDNGILPRGGVVTPKSSHHM